MDHRRGRRGRRGKGKRNEVPAQQLPEETTARQPDPVDPIFLVRHFQTDVGSDFCAHTFHRKSTEESGGYDYEFVDSPPDELICSICLSVLRDPNLTSCCGNHFCHSCIRRIKSKRNPCPLCQDQYYTIMLDKSFVRRVKELKIKCPSSGRGCEWVNELGSLQKHLDVSCGFVEVTCDYCRSDDILRHSLADHRKYICPLRPYGCEYCGLRETWDSITRIHFDVCEKYPVKCPNSCGIGEIQRIDVDKHVRDECPLGEVGCKFEYAGCCVRLPRKDIGQHLSDKVSSHLDMVVMTFQEKLEGKDKVIDELKANIESQRREIAALKVSAESQGKDILTLTTNVQSQGRDISKLRGNVQSQYRRTEELKVSTESHTREQNRQISKLEATVESLTGTLEKVDSEAGDLRSIFYVQVFQLLKDIASKNRDMCILNDKRAEVAMLGTIGGAALGMTAGRAMGPAGQLLGSIVGGSLGALAGFASSEPETVVNLLSKMNEEEQQVMAASAIIVAQEWDFDIIEQLFGKALLCNPRQARSFLVAVLHKRNIVVHYRGR